MQIKIGSTDLLQYLNPTNLGKISILQKMCYLNKMPRSPRRPQKGGTLIDPQLLNSVDVIQVGYHGHLTNITFTIPSNIYLITPLCCGFVNYAITDYSMFFQF